MFVPTNVLVQTCAKFVLSNVLVQICAKYARFQRFGPFRCTFMPALCFEQFSVATSYFGQQIPFSTPMCVVSSRLRVRRRYWVEAFVVCCPSQSGAGSSDGANSAHGGYGTSAGGGSSGGANSAHGGTGTSAGGGSSGGASSAHGGTGTSREP